MKWKIHKGDLEKYYIKNLIGNVGENNKTYQLIDIIKRLIEVNRNQRLNSPDIFINYLNTIC